MRSKVLSVFLCTFFFLSPFFVSAQSQVLVRGRLMDAKSGEPVAFATVKLRSKPLGTISNSDGSFKIPNKYRINRDTIVITSIGYTTKVVALQQLKLDTVNTIYVHTATAQLQEVVVEAKKKKSMSAYKVVREAIRHMADNYPHHPYSYNAYYRDYQIDSGRYVNLNEAQVEVTDLGFQANDYLTTGLRLLKYRKNEDFKTDSLTAIPYDNEEKKFIPESTVSAFGGNELCILRIHDALRNSQVKTYSYVNIFENNFLENHFFCL